MNPWKIVGNMRVHWELVCICLVFGKWQHLYKQVDQDRAQGGGPVARATAPLPSSTEVPLSPSPHHPSSKRSVTAKDPLIPLIRSMFYSPLFRYFLFIYFFCCRKSGLCWDGSMIQLLQIYELHIHDVNLPFLHIPKGLFWDLETVEVVWVHWTCVCVHVFMHNVLRASLLLKAYHNLFKCPHLLWW